MKRNQEHNGTDSEVDEAPAKRNAPKMQVAGESPQKCTEKGWVAMRAS